MTKSFDHTSNALGQKDIHRLFWNYALPAIIATTASSLYNIIDRIFIGNGVGPLAISGLALTFPIMNLSTALGTLVCAGAGSLVSIRLGERRLDTARQTLGNCFTLNILSGLFTAVVFLSLMTPLLKIFGASNDTLPYAREFLVIILSGNVITQLFFGMNSILRASGHPTKAMLSTLLTVLTNIILAPIFIFVCHWGIRGAASATMLSQTIGLAWSLYHILKKDNEVRFVKGCFKPSWPLIKNIYAIGLSPFIIHCCTCVVVIIVNMQLKRYGDLNIAVSTIQGHQVMGGDLAIGAFGIINSIAGFMVLILLGLAQGMQPIAGYNYGAKQMSRVKSVLKITILYASLSAIIGTIICQGFPQQIASLFTNDAHITAITARGLRIYMSLFLFSGFQVVTSHFFQSINKASVSITISLLRQVVCLIPCLLILPMWIGTDGVWVSQAIADLMAAIITGGILFYHLRHGILRTKNEA